MRKYTFIDNFRRKAQYSRHLNNLICSTSRIDVKELRTSKHIPKTNFFGVGPKKTLDQQISFINENMHMARRIKQQAARNSTEAKMRNTMSKIQKKDDPHLIRGDYYQGGGELFTQSG